MKTPKEIENFIGRKLSEKEIKTFNQDIPLPYVKYKTKTPKEIEVKSFFDGKIISKSEEYFLIGMTIGLLIGFVLCGIIYEVYIL